MSRNSKRHFRRPSPSKSSVNGVHVYVKNLSEFRDASGNSINLKNSISSHVPLLLLSSSPRAVSGFIVSVVIKSFNCEGSRAFSHIGQKITERAPSLTNGNTSSAVVLPPTVFRVAASLVHGPPNSISSVVYFLSHGIGQFNVMFSGDRRLTPSDHRDYFTS